MDEIPDAEYKVVEHQIAPPLELISLVEQLNSQTLVVINDSIC